MTTSTDPSTAVPGAATPEPSRGRMLALLAAGHGVTHWFDGILRVSLPLITRDFGITYTQLGRFARLNVYPTSSASPSAAWRRTS